MEQFIAFAMTFTAQLCLGLIVFIIQLSQETFYDANTMLSSLALPVKLLAYL